MEATITPDAWHRAQMAYSDFAEHVMEAVEGVDLGVSLSERMSRLAWQLAVEDQVAIGVLMAKRCVGSVRSLIRPQFESLVRGAWALRCADDNVLQGIVEYRGSFPTLAPAVRALNALKPRFTVLGDEVPFHELDRRGRDAMNDLTHRGTRSLARRSLANFGGPQCVDDDELALFHLGTSIGGIAAAALLEQAGDETRAAEILRRLECATAAWLGSDANVTTPPDGPIL